MSGPISQRFIDDLLARVDIAELIAERVTLKKAGRNLQGLCPFHDEKSPSFTVSREKQFYHCFGCGAGGNAVRFLMEYDRLSFPEAVEQLASRLGVEVEREDDHLTPHQREQRAISQRKKEQGVNLLELSAQWFAQCLNENGADNARDYLSRRGLNTPIISAFGIGYAPESWENLKHYLLNHGVSEAVQVEYGLLVQREDSTRTYDRFRDRVMFPIRDWKGRVIGFGGRVLGDAKPKYLNSPETPVFHKGRELYGLYEARQHDTRLQRLIVVEGYMDVVALAQHGISNAVATLGTAITEDHLQRIFRLVDEVVFCFDGDEAGRRAAKKAMEVALPAMIDGRQARFLFLPETEDPDSLVRKEGYEAFEARIESAISLPEFIFEQAREGLDIKRIEGRERFISHVLERIRLLPDGVLRSLLMTELAKKGGVSAEQLQQLVGEPGRFARKVNVWQSGVAENESGGDEASAFDHESEVQTASRVGRAQSTRVLHLLLRKPSLVSLLPGDDNWMPQDEDGELLRDVVNHLRAVHTQSPNVILMRFSGTPQGVRLSSLWHSDPVLPVSAYEVELKDLVDKLQRQYQQLSPEEELNHLMALSKRDKLSREQRQRLGVLFIELGFGGKGRS